MKNNLALAAVVLVLGAVGYLVKADTKIAEILDRVKKYVS